MVEWLWVGALFVAVSSLCFALVQGASRRQNQVNGRLRQDDEEDETSVLEGLASSMDDDGLGSSERLDLQRELRDAGYYRPTAVREYALVRSLLVLLPLMVAGALALVVDRAYMLRVALFGGLAAVLGYSLPRLFLNYRARRRARQIEMGLPVAVDLLALALSAGQNILLAFRRVSQELRPAYPVLAGELLIVSRQADLRSLEGALRQMADRVRIPEVRNLAVILVQSERLGTDLISALLEFSSSFRTTLKQRAERYANKASFWMVFPTLFCMWLPAAALIVGPVFYEFWNRRQHSGEVLRDRKSVKEAQERGRSTKHLGGGAADANGGAGNEGNAEP